MSLSVGLVRIDYSKSPRSGAAYDYAKKLAFYDDGGCWRLSSEGNVIAEFRYDVLARHAMDYIESSNLPSNEAHELMRWVRGLPWSQGHVMLHFGY